MVRLALDYENLPHHRHHPHSHRVRLCPRHAVDAADELIKPMSHPLIEEEIEAFDKEFAWLYNSEVTERGVAKDFDYERLKDYFRDALTRYTRAVVAANLENLLAENKT